MWNLQIFCVLRSLFKLLNQVVTVCIIYSHTIGFVLYHIEHKCVHLIVAIDTSNFLKQPSAIGLFNVSTLRSVTAESLRII